jgi:hypothetical protein
MVLICYTEFQWIEEKYQQTDGSRQSANALFYEKLISGEKHKLRS